jgi:hypothetical protein
MVTMNRSAIYISYVRSLLWIALLMAIAVGLAIIVMTVFVDFVHGNSHRTKANAIFMIMFFPVILGIVTIVGSLLVFALPQCFQAVVTDVLVSRFGRVAQFGVLLALPLTATVAWYCYDYLTPTDFNLGINVGDDWTPYHHGLTLRRYLAMLVIQTPISLFGLWHCDATIRNASKKWVIRAAIALAGVAGVMWGYGMARTQYQFL